MPDSTRTQDPSATTDPATEPAAQDDGGDPKTVPLAMAAAAGTLFTIVTLIALETLFYATERSVFFGKVEGQASPSLIDRRVEQEARLSQYRWVNEEAGVVGLPIERAMKLVAEDLAAGRPAVTTRPSESSNGESAANN